MIRVMAANKKASLITALAFISLVCCIGCDLLEDTSEGKAAQEELEREFKSIRHLPQVRSCNYEASHKSRQAYVGSSYQTQSGYSGIRAHYDDELLKKGWKLQREKPVYYWGRDYGGLIAYYCKGQYRASVHYSGKDSGFGRTYAFSLS